MDSVMHIGNIVDKDTADNIAGAITKVFESAHENRMDQETVREAIEILRFSFAMAPVTVSHCNISSKGETAINVDSEDVEIRG